MKLSILFLTIMAVLMASVVVKEAVLFLFNFSSEMSEKIDNVGNWLFGIALFFFALFLISLAAQNRVI